ncbi:hypothetical protein LTI14_04350 [Nesterenkonia sp. YGD6]|uniref:hypothetical protein n=1 Tax=Nesterenkonia sp. YGD6 TaxID=2901231 RepID=UPI001F4CF51E|nr:hypothetical protein [Nesterenkonia sp. YGD6]MCH8562453.1 hypothetical protein [Nesterenkonia sp. YGD6]
MNSEWETVLLSEVFAVSNLRLGEHVEEPPVFAISKYHGVVLGSDYHGRRVASAALDGYKVLGRDDWAYSTIHIDEGSIARNRHAFSGVVSPMYTILRWTSTHHDARYFELLLRSPAMLNEYGNMAQGSVNRRRSLPWKRFSNISVNVPPVEEQRRIVDLVGALDATVDAADEQAQAADALWWRLSRHLESEVSGQETIEFGQIADISGGLTKNKKDLERDDLVEVPYLRVANVHRRHLDLEEVATIRTSPAKLEQLRLQPGDLVMNEGGDKDKLGRGAVWRGEIADCIHQNHVFRARVTAQAFVPEFVSAWANSFGQSWFETYGTQTTGIASISKTTLARFPVPVMALATQTEWANLFDAAMQAHDAARATVRSLRTLRTDLLSVLQFGSHIIPESYNEFMDIAEAQVLT